MQKFERKMQSESSGGLDPGLRSAFRIPRSAFSRSRAFSLTEILIVIAIIVLMLAMALPAFNFISGSRSIEGAQNQVSAFLAQARADAVGLQDYRGVLFYLDPNTDREMMALVQATPGKSIDSTTNSQVDVWLGLVPEMGNVAIPKGVGIQIANDPTATGYDRYIGFNQLSSPVPVAGDPLVGGVILFDGNGQLATKHWALRLTDLTTASTGPPNATGQLFYRAEIAASAATTTKDQSVQNVSNIAPRSSMAFILFERGVAEEQFGSGFNSDLDFLANSKVSNAEASEETWLDSNATPFCIDRFNGTLIKGQ